MNRGVSGEFEPCDAEEEEQPIKSVKEMAASLARVSGAEESVGNRKSSSLPRNATSASPTSPAAQNSGMIDLNQSVKQF